LDERRSCLFNGKEGDEKFLSSFQEDVKSNKKCFFLDEGKRGWGAERMCLLLLGMKNTLLTAFFLECFHP